MSIRTFIALPLSPGQATLDALKDLKLLLEGERISWVDPASFHITIRFIGDTSVSQTDSIREVLQERVALPGRTTLRFSGPGLFGPRRSPRVVYLGFEEEPMLGDLHRKVELALDSCGIPPAGNSFRAHLTLGRIRALHDLRGLENAVEDMKGRFSQEVQACRLVFYRSNMGAGPPVYTPLWSAGFPD